MPQDFDNISFFVGNQDVLFDIEKNKPLPIFSKETVGFLDALSKKLLKLPITKKFSDIVTFAFWCRKANVCSMKYDYENERNRMGKGVIFHIAPSNIPINFAYSLVAGMLAGNANIVRLSSKEFEQIDILCNEIKILLHSEEFIEISKRMCLIKYSHSKEITDHLTQKCSVRVIWGGDGTITDIRKSPLSPRSTEITFADRYSLCLINADKYLSQYDYKKTAQDFYNDTYLTDQNACTSPRFIIWNGEKVNEAKETFWRNILDIIDDKYDIKPVQVVNKLTTFYKAAATHDVKLSTNSTNKLVRIEVEKFDVDLINYLDNSGYFYELTVKDIREIDSLCGVKCQTISYIGFDKNNLYNFMTDIMPVGVDRVTPVGKTMDFSLVWDGFDLINSLSKKYNIC